MKIDGKIYEATVALVQDRDEVAELLGRSPITIQEDENGQKQVTSVRHYWRVFQRISQSTEWIGDVRNRQKKAPSGAFFIPHNFRSESLGD